MNTAESFRNAQERKVNGPNGYKRTERSTFQPLAPDSPLVRISTNFWRAATTFAPGFNFKVTYHA